MKDFLVQKEGTEIEDEYGTAHSNCIAIPEETTENRHGYMEVLVNVYKSKNHLTKKPLGKFVFQFTKDALSIPIPDTDENGDVKIDDNGNPIYKQRPKLSELGQPLLDEDGKMIMVNQETPKSHIGSIGIMASMYHMEEVEGEFVLIHPKNILSKIWILNQDWRGKKIGYYFEFPE